MGVSYESYGIIGIGLNTDDLMPKTTVKTFEHDYPQSMKFDPNTGKKLWKEVRIPILEFNEETSQLGNYPVIQEADGTCIVALLKTTAKDGDKSQSFLKIPDNLPEIFLEMKQFLESLGLWRQEKFGQYAVLFCNH